MQKLSAAQRLKIGNTGRQIFTTARRFCRPVHIYFIIFILATELSPFRYEHFQNTRWHQNVVKYHYTRSFVLPSECHEWSAVAHLHLFCFKATQLLS